MIEARPPGLSNGSCHLGRRFAGWCQPLVIPAAALLPAAVLVACGGQRQVTFALGSAHVDVPYCNSQKLDQYIPEGPTAAPLALAIFVHGGGMTAGDKSYLDPVLLERWPLSGRPSRASTTDSRRSSSSRHSSRM